MVAWFSQLDPVLQALLATIFTWLMTAIGAATVFLFKELNRTVLNTMLGFAAGRHDRRELFLAPGASDRDGGRYAISTLAASNHRLPCRWGCLWLIDKILPHLHFGLPMEEAEGIHTGWRRVILLVLAITLHNFPEGLAVGVAFGAVAAGLPSATLLGAVALAIGIGIQNFPEGAAVSIPLRREGFSRPRSFWYGQLSGMVEPVAGVLGAVAVLAMRQMLPFALAFAAGAMIFVVVEDLIPEAQRNESTDVATVGALVGFALMMALDVALG